MFINYLQLITYYRIQYFMKILYLNRESCKKFDLFPESIQQRLLVTSSQRSGCGLALSCLVSQPSGVLGCGVSLHRSMGLPK